MTSLDEAMREVRLDQSVVDQAVKGIDFSLAAEILAMKVRALPPDRYDARLFDAEFLETCVRDLVLSELKAGRERSMGIVGSHQKAFFRASYALAKASDFEDSGPIVERVDVEFVPLSSVGMRPTASYMREVRAYLDLFPGHELDEDGRLKRIDANEGSS